MHSNTFVITGATGYLGSRIALKLIREGWTGIAIVRDKGLITSRQRLEMSLRSLGATTADLGSICSVAADLLDDQLILPHVSTGVDAFIHCAAMVKTNRDEREVTRANLEGTKMALRLAAESQAESFIHIGTAYSCGQGSQDPQTPSVISEETRFETFNNAYEASKAAAESRVKQTDINWTILRPTILYHNASSGHAGGAESGSDLGLVGWFNLIIAAHRIATKNSIHKIRIPGHESANLNLLDVDEFAAMVTDVVKVKLLEPDLFRQQDFIVANNHEIRVSDLIKTLERANINGIELLNGSFPAGLTRPENAYARQGEFFSSYASQFVHFRNDKFTNAMLSAGYEIKFKSANPNDCMPPNSEQSFHQSTESGHMNLANPEYRAP
jgi:nucleoside-diphosphate-sugar epimerase